MKIETEEDVRKAGRWFLDQGVKSVYITLNKDGVYYIDEHGDGFIRPKEGLNVVSATGAGDSFSATIMLGYVNGRTAEETARMGMAAASIAMESAREVNKDMNMEELLRRI